MQSASCVPGSLAPQRRFAGIWPPGPLQFASQALPRRAPVRVIGDAAPISQRRLSEDFELRTAGVLPRSAIKPHSRPPAAQRH